MKKIIIFLILISIFLSCKKKEETEYKDTSGEIVYTDSFSPEEWENPINRQKVEAIDKDIGKFINEDIMDPNLRRILLVIQAFFKNVNENNINEIKKILTPSAYNSYTLRFPQVKFLKEYKLRIAYPENFQNQVQSANASVSSISTQQKSSASTLLIDHQWVKFKILFPTKSVISKFEIEFNNDDTLISDFDNQFFIDIGNTLKKAK